MDCDSPSICGRFSWCEFGGITLPCLFRSCGTRYISTRIVERTVMLKYLTNLNPEVFNCINIRSLYLTAAEVALLNEINRFHCDFSFGTEPFSIAKDFLIKWNDLIKYMEFLRTCDEKLAACLQGPGSVTRDKCGFVRINDDSMVAYIVKNGCKYIPLFYFDGQIARLESRVIDLKKWDMAYLRFCCKIQGLSSELYANERCLAAPLEDIKLFLAEDTTYDEHYWPILRVPEQMPHQGAPPPPFDSSAVVTISQPPSSITTPASMDARTRSASEDESSIDHRAKVNNATITQVSVPCCSQDSDSFNDTYWW